jgi:hypothetical protein
MRNSLTIVLTLMTGVLVGMGVLTLMSGDDGMTRQVSRRWGWILYRYMRKARWMKAL